MLKKNQALRFPTLITIQFLSVPFYLNCQELLKPHPRGVCSDYESPAQQTSFKYFVSISCSKISELAVFLSAA